MLKDKWKQYGTINLISNVKWEELFTDNDKTRQKMFGTLLKKRRTMYTRHTKGEFIRLVIKFGHCKSYKNYLEIL